MQHPRVPWIHYQAASGGGILVTDTRTNEQAIADDWVGVEQFAADHSAAPGYGGAGDLVRAATERMGIAPCTPCAARQQAMNGWFPRVFRR